MAATDPSQGRSRRRTTPAARSSPGGKGGSASSSDRGKMQSASGGQRPAPPPLPSLISAFVLVLLSAAARSSASSASSSSRSASVDSLERIRYGTLPPTVFAPTGRLHMVDAAARRASDPADLSGSTVVALRCRRRSGDVDGDDGGEFVAVALAGPRSPHAYYGGTEDEERKAGGVGDDGDDGAGKAKDDKDSGDADADADDSSYRSPLVLEDDGDDVFGLILPHSPPISVLSPSLVVAAAGSASDSAVFLRRIQDAALSLYRSDDGGVAAPLMGHGGGRRGRDGYGRGGGGGIGGAVRSADLARRVADAVQVPTQTVGTSAGRMLASSALILGTADGRGGWRCRIWRVDPTGQFWDCDAAAAGRGAGVAEAGLLRRAARWKRTEEGGSSSVTTATDGGGSASSYSVDAAAAGGGEEEPEMDEIMETLSNADVRTYLATLSVDEALAVAYQCLADARKEGKDAAVKCGKEDGARYIGIQGMILRPARDGSRGRRGPSVEVLSWETLRRRLDLQEQC